MYVVAMMHVIFVSDGNIFEACKDGNLEMLKQ